MKTLTKSQSRVLEFISNFQYENLCSPYIKEISDHFGWKSKNSAVKHLKALEQKKHLSFYKGRIQFLYDFK